MLPPTVALSCYVSVAILQILLNVCYVLCFVRVRLMLVMKNNPTQQNVLSFSVSSVIRELSSPRVVKSTSWQSVSWYVHELSSKHVGMQAWKLVHCGVKYGDNRNANYCC